MNDEITYDWEVKQHKSDFTIFWKVTWCHHVWMFDNEEYARGFAKYWE